MFKNRFLLVIGVLSLLLVTMAVSLSFSDTPSSAADTSRWEAMGKYYANQARAESQNVAPAKDVECETNLVPDAGLDSATRSYLAWAKAVEAESYAVDSATQSYMAQAKAIEAKGYAIDSATRSYIAWDRAVEVQGLAC